MTLNGDSLLVRENELKSLIEGGTIIQYRKKFKQHESALGLPRNLGAFFPVDIRLFVKYRTWGPNITA